MSLAIFDLDHTILRGDSDSTWLKYLIKHNQVDAAEAGELSEKFLADYEDGTLIFDDYAKFAYGIMAKLQLPQLLRLRADFFQHEIKPLICPNAVKRLEEHRRQGDTVIISTATNDFITRPPADYLQVEHLLATQMEMVSGRFTGNYLGTPNFREGKRDNALAWLREHPEYTLADTYFYSDSQNDLPLLLQVGYPRPVNADSELARVSQERNWQLLHWAAPKPAASQ